ncbi:MAG: hypothetical protein ACE5FP_06020, partial [Gemmatimonadota bacterium]
TGLLLAAGTTAIGDVHPDAKRLADQRRESFSLFAGPTAVLQGNQLQCGLTNDGNGTCTDVFNSPTGGGGFWPTGSPNQYIFNTGIQFAAIHGPDAGPWASDTVGAFFFDASGRNPSGTAVTNIFDSLNPDDVENWPAEAFVDDPDIFQDVLVGRKTASQQDSWMQYWDGDPSKIRGRQHPMGVTVTSRSLAWNFPAGNESLIYFIFAVRNSTADSEFQRLNEAQFFAGGDALPNAGFTLTETYGAFATDMDVTANAGQNYSTVILPFDLGLSYHGGFSAPTFEYSPDIFFPPFFTTAPGLIGIKYLRSPIDPATGTEVGLTLFSVTLNAPTGFPDPSNDRQLWRYLSGKVDPSQGDFPCTVTPEVVNADPALQQRSICFLTQTAADTRFYQASGPFDIAPDGVAKIVVAYIAAATVATLPDGSPSGISANDPNANANPPGIASFHPGFPSARGCTDASATTCTEVDNVNAIKAMERGAGWVAYTGPPPANALEGPSQKLDQFQVTFVPGSLIGKALVAQTIFDNKFLLGFAPEQPTFFLVPGNNNVTVIWDTSSTEDPLGEGDPFFAVASDPASALFNPNYKQFDVEGYRIWRGTNPGNLELISQFDYGNTTFTDSTCETVPTDLTLPGATNPGFVVGDVCPVGFSITSGINSGLVFNNGSAGGPPGGGNVRLADGSALAVTPTVTIVDDEAGAKVPLTDGGVPFVFLDNAVTNNFTYFYSVSVFDVNSLASGPHTLRSARVAQSTVPRADAPNVVNAELETFISGDDGVALSSTAPFPTVDSGSGVWSGPMPPTDAYTLGFAPVLPRLLPQLALSVTIDSIRIDASGNLAGGTQEFPPAASGLCPSLGPEGKVGSHFGACWHMHLTTTLDGVATQSVVDGYNPWWDAFGGISVFDLSVVSQAVPFDQDALDAFGIPSGQGFATTDVRLGEAFSMTAAEGAQNRRQGNFHTGARWIDGNTTQGATAVDDPSVYRKVGEVSQADVWAPISHTPIDAADEAAGCPGAGGCGGAGNGVMFEKQCFNRGMAFNDRAADIVFTWSGGTVTARDVVHNVPVVFAPRAGPGVFGFITDANANGMLDWHDFNYIDGALEIIRQVDGGNCNIFGGARFDAGLTATPISMTSSPTILPTSTFMDAVVDLENGAALPVTGTGFGMYVNGHRFLFEAATTPSDGTEWTLRTFYGNLAVSTGGDDPSGYALTQDAGGGWGGEGFALRRPMLIPGLTFNWNVANATAASGPVDLTRVHTVPDPYLGTSLYDLSPTSKQLMFVNLPPEATIRIFSLTGVLVDVLVHDDITAGGRQVWDVRNRNNQFVASGVYFYHVVTPTGEEHVGKFTIINQAGSN